jgi:hypothetical protein
MTDDQTTLGAAMREIRADWRPIGADLGHECDDCGRPVPDSEYGLHILPELWAKVAPFEPDLDTGDPVWTGVLCLDCIEERLGREVTGWDVVAFNCYGHEPTDRFCRLIGQVLVRSEER